MPRLARKNIKVFAGSATNNGVFGSLQANNPTITSDVEQIQSLTAWGEGWNAATETSEELPPLEEIQGVEYVTTYQQAYIMQEGVPEWAATVTYYKGSLTKEVTSTGFRIYNSLTDNNTGNLLSDTSNWKKVMDSDDLYAFDSAVVHNTGNESVAGVKDFLLSPLVPTPSSGDNSQKAASTAFVAGVASDLQTQINTKASSSDVIHKTGSETYTGVKSNQITLDLNKRNWQNTNDFLTNLDQTVALDYDQTIYTNVVRDKNNDFFSWITTNYSPVRKTYASFSARCKNSNNTANVTCELYLVANPDGTSHASCPASDVNGSIVTTVNKSKAQNGYFKLGNGLIIQWGYSNQSGHTTTVTLPTPFTSTNYAVTISRYAKEWAEGVMMQTNNYKTTSFDFTANDPGVHWIAIGY